MRAAAVPTANGPAMPSSPGRPSRRSPRRASASTRSLEVEGNGRAAFALVANADPYTYLGRVPLRLPRGARLEGGLDLLAPRSLRLRSLPGAVRYIATGRTRLPLIELRDADRISIRCDGPMPLQLDGEDLGDVTEVAFEAERDAVTVLV